MGALIVLHGLFLLHCNATKVVLNQNQLPLQPQTCEILSADTAGHSLLVGQDSGHTVALPSSLKMTLSPNPTPGGGPDANFHTRMLALDSSVVTVASKKATYRIIVPMPDNIWGANVLRAFRDDVLGRTDPNALLSQYDGQNRIALAETIILAYNTGEPFALFDNGAAVQGARSTPVAGKNNVLTFFSWPVSTSSGTCTFMSHVPLNALLLVGGAAPQFQLMGLASIHALDDAYVSVFNLPANILRPQCVIDPMTLMADGVFHPYTATQTGCGPEVDIDYGQ